MLAGYYNLDLYSDFAEIFKRAADEFANLHLDELSAVRRRGYSAH